MPFTVYALFDEREPDVVRYVGFSCDVTKRLREHVADIRKTESTRKIRWLQLILSEGIKPSWRALDVVETVEAAAAIERIRIKEYLGLGHPLTNGTHGGDGATAWALPETREQQRRMMEEHWSSPEGEAHRQRNVEENKRIQTGLKRSDEAKAKMAAAKLGKPHARQRTAEWNEKIGASQRGIKRRPWTEEERKARSGAGVSAETRAKMSAAAKARVR